MYRKKTSDENGRTTMLKIGIDNYCYHRLFENGDWSIFDFLKRAVELNVDGVSLETCFFPNFESDYLKKVRDALDKANFDRVLAWGHPDGLEGGKNLEAAEELKAQFKTAKSLGAKVMRIVGSSYLFRDEPHDLQVSRVSEILKHVVKVAESYDVVMGIENHLTFTADEILQILENVASEYLRVTLDTGNALRVFENPVEAARKLVPYTVATHVKDVTVAKGSPKDINFWPSVPVGMGIIDMPAIVSVLRDAGYQGMLCIEVDRLSENWQGKEDAAVEESIRYLKSLIR